MSALYPLSLVAWAFEGAMLLVLVVSRFTWKVDQA